MNKDVWLSEEIRLENNRNIFRHSDNGRLRILTRLLDIYLNVAFDDSCYVLLIQA